MVKHVTGRYPEESGQEFPPFAGCQLFLCPSHHLTEGKDAVSADEPLKLNPPRYDRDEVYSGERAGEDAACPAEGGGGGAWLRGVHGLMVT